MSLKAYALDWAILQVAGEDARAFLQGQTTNDVRQIENNLFQFNAICNPKGRILTTFYLYQQRGIYHLLLPADNADFIQQRLRLYVLRAKVSLQQIDNKRCFGLFAHEAAQLTPLFTPLARNQCAHEADNTLLAYDDNRYVLIAGEPLSHSLSMQTDAAWALADVQAKIPTVNAALREQFIPQMIDLPLLKGVSFTKGCYTGQEVVARVHYLGKAKQRMVLAQLHSATCPVVGDAVFSGDENIGQIVAAAFDGPVCHCLVVLPESAQAVHWQSVALELNRAET
jgi:folate-binding protein YgfZ